MIMIWSWYEERPWYEERRNIFEGRFIVAHCSLNLIKRNEINNLHTWRNFEFFCIFVVVNIQTLTSLQVTSLLVNKNSLLELSSDDVSPRFKSSSLLNHWVAHLLSAEGIGENFMLPSQKNTAVYKHFLMWALDLLLH